MNTLNQENPHPSPPWETPHSAELQREVFIPLDEVKAPAYFEGPKHEGDNREKALGAASNLLILLEAKNDVEKSRIDSLTGLFRAEMLDDMTDRIIEHNNNAEKSTSYYVVVLDVNNLKDVNDYAAGKHITGDKYLKIVSKVIKELLYPGDLAVRRGGDEFVILMPVASDTPPIDELEKIYNDKFRNMLEVELENDEEIKPTLVARGREPGVSVGSGFWDGMSNHSFGKAFSAADSSMYARKPDRTS